MQNLPAESQGAVLDVITEVLSTAVMCATTQHSQQKEAEALVHLLPRMIWPKQAPAADVQGEEQKAQAMHQREVTAISVRLKLFSAGHWKPLWESAEQAAEERRSRRFGTSEATKRAKAGMAIKKTMHTGLGAGLNVLTSEGLAPVTDRTVQLMKDTMVTEKRELPSLQRAAKWKQYATVPGERTIKQTLAEASGR